MSSSILTFFLLPSPFPCPLSLSLCCCCRISSPCSRSFLSFSLKGATMFSGGSPSAFGISSSASTKRKRPPRIEIPNVLREVQVDQLKFTGGCTPRNEAVCQASSSGVAVFSVKGKKKFMEDTHQIVSSFPGNPNMGFFGVYDGHGGRKAADFVAENLHSNILEAMSERNKSAAKEEAVKVGYLKTDEEFLKKGLGSGACCVTALIEGQDIVVSNLGDCRAVLSRGGVAEVLTNDHKAEQEDEQKRIEEKGGFVVMHRGAWRVHGILAVSRSIGNAHLKQWVMAEPETTLLQLSQDMEFLVLASDGLWDEVSNQEAVDIVTRRLYTTEKKLSNMSELDKYEDFTEYGYVNVSPSSKLRRIALVKPTETSLSPVCVKSFDTPKGEDLEENTVLEIEIDSPLSKLRKVSSLSRSNAKTEDSDQENSYLDKGFSFSSLGLVSSCKELVKLAVSRGSLDDITVMIIDLNYFRSK